HMLRERFLHAVNPNDNRGLLHVLTNHRIWTSLWRGREPIGFPIRACDADGRRCDLEVSALAARHPNQMREEVYFTLIDITERNASRIALMERSADLETLSKRLQDSNMRLDQFASVAAHDLLAPLRRIAAFADMLDDELGQSEHDSVVYALNAIRRSATAGQRLVEDILQLSRISSLDPRLEPFDVSTVFAEVAAEFEDTLSEIGGAIDYAGEPLTAEGDARLAKLILRNLLSNAIKYRHPDRALRIQFRQSTTGTPHARLELIDNGVGMDSSQAQHAFDPFVRLSDNSDVPGHGLGLAIAEEAAIAMGWHVFAHSEPDQGTRMVVTAPLPRAEADATAG
ncbi:MAG: HAMP domain-containing sensor histidine kinase, partial [Pseudomonadota bacterium]